MDLKQIKELMTAMEKAGAKKLSLKEKTGLEICIEMQEGAMMTPAHSFHPVVSRAHEIAVHAAPSHPPIAAEAPKEGKFIPSPMVGTFYTAASPDQPSFVKVGDKVQENTIVCIIEAMKVMNEVKAGISGVIQEVCVDNGHPVEFGTKLFQIV